MANRRQELAFAAHFPEPPAILDRDAKHIFNFYDQFGTSSPDGRTLNEFLTTPAKTAA
jgi:hypothetical protein